MSKIGKKSIEIPKGVTISLTKGIVTVSGSKGILSCEIGNRVKVVIEESVVTVEPADQKSTQYQGLYRTLIANCIEGVSNGVSKKLEFHGIGYKAAVNGGNLVLNVGYSHPVTIEKIQGVDFAVQDNVITVSGIDKVLIGDIAAKIRAVRKPEPYKGKGIRYQGEYIIRKESKSSK